VGEALFFLTPRESAKEAVMFKLLKTIKEAGKQRRLPRPATRRRKLFPGQVSLEFMFGIMGAVLLLVGMIQVFAWTGQDLLSRMDRHNSVLLTPFNYDQVASPLDQVRPIVGSTTRIEAAVNSNVFGEENP
jgi:hypothetical protein